MERKPLFGEIIEAHEGLADELRATDVAADLALLLEHSKLSRADLARKLNWTRPRVSQVLSGNGNLTIQTIAAIASALGYTFDLVYRYPHDPAPAQPWLRSPDATKVTLETGNNLELKAWMSRTTMTPQVEKGFHGGHEVFRRDFSVSSNQDRIFPELSNAA